MPERGARRDVLEVEEIELRAEPTVVAAARVFEVLEVRVEIRLRVERRPVDAGQLLVVLVAAPVRAGDARQLERLDRLRVLQVRAAAEIDEVALLVERDVALRGVEELQLVRLVGRQEALTRFLGSHRAALPVAAFLQLALHLRFDSLQVGVGDRLREVEVVVEAVLDRRADRHLHAGVEAAHCLGEQMRRGMAQDGERVGVVRVARRQDLDPRAVGERLAQILRPAVGPDQHRLLRESRADRARGFEAGRAVGKLELGVVGKDDVHGRQG